MLPRILSLAALLIMSALSTDAAESKTNATINAHAETITLGAGCFWCTEAVFQQIPGVVSVKPGYMGGKTKNPTYEDITTGQTGHAEVAQVIFDTQKTSLAKILEIFWEAHDPTTLNRQGADVGTQYRSAIFYHSDEQKKIAEQSKTKAGQKFADPIVTEIAKAEVFYVAENYHHDYYNRNKDKNPYCRMVIAPKLRKLKLKD